MATNKTPKPEHQNPHYKGIGRIMRDSLRRRYGDSWTSLFSAEIARNLVRAEAFNIMQSQHSDDETKAGDVQRHGWNCYLAGLDACGLADD